MISYRIYRDHSRWVEMNEWQAFWDSEAWCEAMKISDFRIFLFRIDFLAIWCSTIFTLRLPKLFKWRGGKICNVCEAFPMYEWGFPDFPWKYSNNFQSISCSRTWRKWILFMSRCDEISVSNCTLNKSEEIFQVVADLEEIPLNNNNFMRDKKFWNYFFALAEKCIKWNRRIECQNLQSFKVSIAVI